MSMATRVTGISLVRIVDTYLGVLYLKWDCGTCMLTDKDILLLGQSEIIIIKYGSANVTKISKLCMAIRSTEKLWKCCFSTISGSMTVYKHKRVCSKWFVENVSSKVVERYKNARPLSLNLNLRYNIIPPWGTKFPFDIDSIYYKHICMQKDLLYLGVEQ